MPHLTLTIALEHYGRHMPFFLGAVTPPAGVELEPFEVGMAPSMRHSADPAGEMLIAGEPDALAECAQYRERVGFMHLMALEEDLAEREPWLPRATVEMWEQAKAQIAGYYADPGFLMLAFAHNEFERQRDGLGDDLWPSGLTASRANLERFIGYRHDQHLIDRPLDPTPLFHEPVLDG